MQTTTSHRILEQILEPVGACLTKDVATRIAALRADIRTQQRLEDLAEKNAEGTLSPREEVEYEAYVEALDMIAILQAKARKFLRSAGRSK